jgi:hypothetical protein
MAVPTFKDELDDLPVSTPAAAKPTRVAVEEDDDKSLVKAAKTTVAVEEEIEDLSVDFGDKQLMLRGDGLERLRPEKGKAVRFAILGEFLKARMAYTHFIDKKGTYRCLVDKIKRTPKDKGGNPDAAGYCCKKLQADSEPTIAVLVVHYKNAESTEGGYEKGATIEWDIKYVQLSKANFQSISRLPEEEQTVNDIDIVMMHTNKAFGYEFHKKSSKPRWKANPALVEEVKEKVKPYLDGKKIDSKLGRKVNELEMKALISSLGAGSDDAKLGDVESL